MASVDLKNNIKTLSAFNAASITSSTTTAGNVISTAGYESLTFDNSIGVRTDGTYTPLIQDCDTVDGVFVAVDDAFLIGTEAEAALTASNTQSTIGYVGKKPFVKFSWVSSAVTSGSTGCKSSAILAAPRSAPVA
jgi:hypothetical protein